MNAGRSILVTLLLAGITVPGLALAANGFVDDPGLLDQIRPGATTAEEVNKLLGPPANIQKFPSQGIESMEYGGRGRLMISISIGRDGKVRDVLRRTLSF
jgi:hypothetical protein